MSRWYKVVSPDWDLSNFQRAPRERGYSSRVGARRLLISPDPRRSRELRWTLNWNWNRKSAQLWGGLNLSQAASCCNSFIINLLLSNPDSTLWTGEESARFEGAEVGSFIPSIDRSINQAVSPAESIFTCPFCVKKGYNQLIDANLSFNDNNCPSLSLSPVSVTLY